MSEVAIQVNALMEAVEAEVSEKVFTFIQEHRVDTLKYLDLLEETGLYFGMDGFEILFEKDHRVLAKMYLPQHDGQYTWYFQPRLDRVITLDVTEMVEKAAESYSN